MSTSVSQLHYASYAGEEIYILQCHSCGRTSTIAVLAGEADYDEWRGAVGCLIDPEQSRSPYTCNIKCIFCNYAEDRQFTFSQHRIERKFYSTWVLRGKRWPPTAIWRRPGNVQVVDKGLFQFCEQCQRGPKLVPWAECLAAMEQQTRCLVRSVDDYVYDWHDYDSAHMSYLQGRLAWLEFMLGKIKHDSETMSSAEGRLSLLEFWLWKVKNHYSRLPTVEDQVSSR